MPAVLAEDKPEMSNDYLHYLPLHNGKECIDYLALVLFLLGTVRYNYEVYVIYTETAQLHGVYTYIAVP